MKRIVLAAVALALAALVALGLTSMPASGAATPYAPAPVKVVAQSSGQGQIWAIAKCPTGKYATGGGYNTTDLRMQVLGSYPLPDTGVPTQWVVEFWNDGFIGTGESFVVCAKR